MAAGNNGLVLHSSIKIHTDEGVDREIQLLFGDITKLPLEDKVDVLLVSAFPGDYIPTRTSLIGALKHNLDISVRDLARNKKEDLRRHFHCWQSHPLPADKPYGEIVCFETPLRSGFRHPAELVGDVFRALIPMFHNMERTVMTPLLATGDQNYSRKVMLKAMLDAAVNWIRAGLPMKYLKIVMYKQDPSWLSREEEELVKMFTDTEKKVSALHKQDKEARKKPYDLYFSYDRQDTDMIKGISKLLLQEHKNLKILEANEAKEDEVAFQSKILESMKQCRKVVTFLSPAFLASSMCVEKYNLALCINRSSQNHLLAPFYIETIDSMPVYMTMVQYVDVRDRDGTNQRLITGVRTFAISLKLTAKHSILRQLDIQYDVFISYSHRNSEKAGHILELFQKLKPDFNIFFDRNNLKTGYSWQQTLYHAIDNTAILVALLSPDYISSLVCTEEFSLASCRHLTEVKDKLELVPIILEPVEKLPHAFAKVPAYDATKDFGASAAHLVNSVINFKEENNVEKAFFSQVETPENLQQILEKSRRKYFQDNYDMNERKQTHKNLDEEALRKEVDEFRKTDEYKKKMDEINAREAKILAVLQAEKENLEKQETEIDDVNVKRDMKLKEEDKVYDIAFICADHLHGTALESLLHKRAPFLSTDFFIQTADAEMMAVEKSKLVVPFLSERMAAISKDMDEFNVALARQRKQDILYPILVSPLAQWPTYCHLVPCNIGIEDKLWFDLAVQHQMMHPDKLPKELVQVNEELDAKFQECLASPALLALSAACDDIISIFRGKSPNWGATKRLVVRNIVDIKNEMDDPVIKKEVKQSKDSPKNAAKSNSVKPDQSSEKKQVNQSNNSPKTVAKSNPVKQDQTSEKAQNSTANNNKTQACVLL